MRLQLIIPRYLVCDGASRNVRSLRPRLALIFPSTDPLSKREIKVCAQNHFVAGGPTHLVMCKGFSVFSFLRETWRISFQVIKN